MNSNSNSKRIVFLDLMRAFAVLMMVQGHTVHTFLSNDLRNSESLFYSIWHVMRGFTAPIFMFTAGVVFTYLLFYNSQTHNKTRLIKGLKRFLLLVGLGYLLRYPTWKIFDFSDVTDEQWRIFFAVDALHLIGFGLLFIILIALLAEKLKVTPYIMFTASVSFFVFTYPFIYSINWNEILTAPLAAYMYSKSGSLFPLFPWVGYVIGGALLGVYLAHNPLIFKKKRFGSSLIVIGLSLMFIYLASSNISYIISGNYLEKAYGVAIFFLRIGFVITLNGIVSLLVIKLDNIPQIIKLIGRHTLLIYIVHLVILYGSAWIPGFYNSYGGSFNTIGTIGAVALMYLVMISMILGLERIKKFRKENFAV